MAHRSLTNNRRLCLCTYDIASTGDGDKRRAKLFELLCDYGEHIQYSVFLCELTAGEHIRILAAAQAILHESKDQLLILDIGHDRFDWTTRLHCVGKTWTPQVRSFII
ncbi:MAG: CRISPR-associated endoribonuclease Cas2 [Verrucomicrobia subdivision 3 bacterium]|nr:CRISPR-associated endoribonuclease Cas2 [Limisphaerales bacterium]MCS1413682.1 CRISPR-associated endoribonuclease Cas2 [Limisphaerales bacterium]